MLKIKRLQDLYSRKERKDIRLRRKIGNHGVMRALRKKVRSEK